MLIYTKCTLNFFLKPILKIRVIAITQIAFAPCSFAPPVTALLPFQRSSSQCNQAINQVPIISILPSLELRLELSPTYHVKFMATWKFEDRIFHSQFFRMPFFLWSLWKWPEDQFSDAHSPLNNRSQHGDLLYVVHPHNHNQWQHNVNSNSSSLCNGGSCNTFTRELLFAEWSNEWTSPFICICPSSKASPRSWRQVVKTARDQTNYPKRENMRGVHIWLIISPMKPLPWGEHLHLRIILVPRLHPPSQRVERVCWLEILPCNEPSLLFLLLEPVWYAAERRKDIMD